MAQTTAPSPLGPAWQQTAGWGAGWSWQGGDAVQGWARPAAQPRPARQVPPSHHARPSHPPSPLQPRGAKEHPQDGIPQALSHGVMEVPLCSSFPLAAAGEHQLGCERGRGEGRRKRGTSARQRQGESWPLRCTCVLQMAGGCHWMVGDGSSLFLDPKLQALAQAWADRTGEKKEKTLNLPHVSLIVSGAPRIGGVQWGVCGNAVQITESKMSECQTADDRRCKTQANTETDQKQTEMNTE